jgi:hypothetical protein
MPGLHSLRAVRARSQHSKTTTFFYSMVVRVTKPPNGTALTNPLTERALLEQRRYRKTTVCRRSVAPGVGHPDEIMISMLNEFAEMERVSEVLAESANECFSSVPISAVLH